MQWLKGFLFVCVSGLYAWVRIGDWTGEFTSAETAPTYILIAATSGCVALLPSGGRFSRFLHVGPLVLTAPFACGVRRLKVPMTIGGDTPKANGTVFAVRLSEPVSPSCTPGMPLPTPRGYSRDAADDEQCRCQLGHDGATRRDLAERALPDQREDSAIDNEE